MQAAVVHDLVNIVIELRLGYKIVLPDRLADDLAYGKPGRKAGKRVLEDDLHLRPDVPQLFAAQIIYFLAVEEHLSSGLFIIKSEDGPASGGFSAAGLADQAHGGTAFEVKGHAVHRLDPAGHMGDHAALDGEVLFQTVDLKNVLRIRLHRGEVV